MSVPMQYGVVMMMTAVSPRMRLLLSCAERTKSLPAQCGTSATPIATASAAATIKLSRKKAVVYGSRAVSLGRDI